MNMKKTKFSSHFRGLVQVCGFQGQRVKQIRWQSRREWSGTARTPTPDVSPSVGRISIMVTVPTQLGVQKIRIRHWFDLRIGGMIARRAVWCRRTSRWSTLGLNVPRHRTRSSTFHPHSAVSTALLTVRFLLGKTLLLAKFCSSVLEPHLKCDQTKNTISGQLSTWFPSLNYNFCISNRIISYR